METLKADPRIIKKLSEQTKCMYCRHKFDEPLILPVDKPQRGKLQPNFSAKQLFHIADTHGYPHDVVIEWIMAAIYGKYAGWEFNK